MLRSLARLTAVLSALALAAPALAQEKAPPAQGDSRLSLGISLMAFDWVGAQVASPVPTSADVQIGLDVGQFRLEPSLGISRYSIDGGQDGSVLNLGCGLLIPIRPGKTVSIYVGPRLFLGFVSAKGGGFSDSGVDFTLAGVMGAEWFADPRFSIGAEARLSYSALSDLSDAGVILRDGASIFATSGHVLFRFYL